MNIRIFKTGKILLMMAIMFTSCDEDEEQFDVRNLPKSGQENGYAYVDLSLPSGVKWATCNVGAENPWDVGDDFAWGETVPFGKEDRSNAHNYQNTGSYVKKGGWDTYKYSNDEYYQFSSSKSLNKLTKYNCNGSYGIVDFKTVLEPVDDAATINMGNRWRMPTEKERNELLNYCYWEWTDNYCDKGKCGYIIYKAKSYSDRGKMRNGKIKFTPQSKYNLKDFHIFIPIGSDSNTITNYYWLSSLDQNTPYLAKTLNVYKDFPSSDSFLENLRTILTWRCYGFMVRAVLDY